MREELRELISAHPFLPFTVFFSDGMQLDVSHPDQIMLTANRVHIAQGSEVHRVSLLHVTRVAVKEPAA
jgi:hypothetical protein